MEHLDHKSLFVKVGTATEFFQVFAAILYLAIRYLEPRDADLLADDSLCYIWAGWRGGSPGFLCPIILCPKKQDCLSQLIQEILRVYYPYGQSCNSDNLRPFGEYQAKNFALRHEDIFAYFPTARQRLKIKTWLIDLLTAREVNQNVLDQFLDSCNLSQPTS
jgi:hypothetical protein